LVKGEGRNGEKGKNVPICLGRDRDGGNGVESLNEKYGFLEAGESDPLYEKKDF